MAECLVNLEALTKIILLVNISIAKLPPPDAKPRFSPLYVSFYGANLSTGAKTHTGDPRWKKSEAHTCLEISKRKELNS